MAYGLAAHVTFCRFPDRLIFLDVAQDRYFAAPAQEADAAGPEAPHLSPVMIEHLLARGLLVSSDRGKPMSPAKAAVPLQSLVESNDARPQGILLPAAMIAMLRARHALRHTPLIDLLEALKRRRDIGASRPRPEPALETLVASFHLARRLLPITPRCLPDSLALLRYLDRYGYHPTLVVGVLAHPFAAHCWVQDDQRILNDAHGHAALFTPILTV
jgi:hypothetical protein